MIFSPGLNTVFASRWKALIWAIGILITAYCSVPSEDESPTDIDALVSQFQPPAPAPVKPQSPWALTKH
jgi:hypothetical protein